MTWNQDKDLWWWRPARTGETNQRCFPDQTQGFVEKGRTYCRSLKQGEMLDRGLPVSMKDAPTDGP